MKLFIRWIVTAIAVGFAVWLIPGIHAEPTAWTAVAVVAGVLALINIYVKPAIKVLGSCFTILTFGLFALVVNAGLLYFSAWLCNTVFGIGFYVDGFWPAFWGGVVISITTMVLNAITGTRD